MVSVTLILEGNIPYTVEMPADELGEFFNALMNQKYLVRYAEDDYEQPEYLIRGDKVLAAYVND